MHTVIDPAILYFGTPVVLVSSTNEDGSANLAPMSSAWWLDLRQDGHPDRIDPVKWRPLIMSFCQFFGLGPMVHPSTLAQIPESAYRPPAHPVTTQDIASQGATPC